MHTQNAEHDIELANIKGRHLGRCLLERNGFEGQQSIAEKQGWGL